jgi:hypothetical protein
MNNPIIYQVVGGLLSVLFLFLTYMFTKTWRWPHVTIMFFVFAAAVCLTAFTAMSVRTHVGWKSVAVNQRRQIEDLTDTHTDLLTGDPAELVHTDLSFRELSARMNRVLLDRGRVWRNCVPTGITPEGSVTVTTTPPEMPAAESDQDPAIDSGTAPVAAAAPTQIPPDLVLYVFQEIAVPPDFGLHPGAKVPVSYLGEFAVISSAENSATLQPTLPLAPSQQQKLQGGGSWALYETMPVDGHQYFSTDPYGTVDLSRPADEVGVFGEMDQTLIEQAFLPQRAQLGERYDEVLQQYLRDGRRAQEDDSPEYQWVKVRFVRSHTEGQEVVDSEAVLDPVANDEGFFDQGRATSPLLQRGAAVEFEPNDIAVFYQGGDFVQRLLDSEVIDPSTIEPIYARQLHNYESRFRMLYQQGVSIDRDAQQAARDNQELTETNARVVERTQYRETEARKLREDLSHFQRELAALTSLHGQLESRRQEQRSELSRIYGENHRLMAELIELEDEVTRQLDANARAALATSN